MVLQIFLVEFSTLYIFRHSYAKRKKEYIHEFPLNRFADRHIFYLAAIKYFGDIK